MNNTKQKRDIDQIKAQYRDFIIQYSNQKAVLDKRSFLISIARFVSFISSLIGFYFAIKGEQNTIWILAIALL